MRRAGIGRKTVRVLMVMAALFMTAGSHDAARAAGSKADQPDQKLMEGLKFRNIGPFRGGRSAAVSGVVGDPLTYYMGSTGGGVWKTTNGGVSWTNISDKFFKTGSVGAIGVAPSDANVIYVGMGESPFRGVASSHGDGVYKSTDAGKTWANVGLTDSRQISRVVVDPRDPDLVYVAVQGSPWAPTATRGIHRSRDGGKSWERIHFINKTTGAIDLKIDPTNPRILYAAMWDTQRKPWEIRSGGEGSGIYKTTDGGDSWKELTKGLPELMGKIGVTVSPAKPERLWAIVEAKEKGGLYRSDDGGDSWSHVNGNRKLHARSWYYMHIFADPLDENTVYVLNSTMFRSVDGGKSVEPISVPHGDTHALWIHPRHPKWMINGNDGGATITFDGGISWSSEHNQPTAQFYRVNVDNQIPYRVYGGQQDNSSVSIASRGADGALGREDYHAVGGCESAHVAFDPDNPRLIYAGCYLGLINEYDEETGRQRDIRAYPALSFGVPPSERKYRFNWNAPIIVSPHDPKVIYHGANKLLKSVDRGHSWTEVSPDLTRNEVDKQGPGGGPITNEVTENYNTIFAITESPHEAGVIWVGSDDGLVHLTRDGGANWLDVTPKGPGEAMVNSIEVSPFDAATAYVAITRYKFNDHTPMIYRTTDYGKSWRRISGGIPDGAFVRVVREDPARKGLLYAGTETGLYVSFDGGGKWRQMQGNLPVVPVTDIKVHGRDLVLSTQGRAFWILDDLSPLRQFDKKIAEAPVHLFAPADAYIMAGGGGGFNGGRGENPPNGAIIYYSLATAPDLKDQEITLEVLDPDGNRVRLLKSDAKKGEKGGGDGTSYALPAKQGLNRAVWDLNRDMAVRIPKVFAIAGGRDQKIDGLRVLPGDYSLRLTLGDETQEQALTVHGDPRVDLPEAAVAEQQQMLGEIFSMIDSLHRSVNKLRSLKAQTESRVKLTKSNDAAADIEEAGKALTDKIDAWEKSVISPEREFFQDVLNWQDRLDSDLQMLMGTVEGSDPPVTAGMKERLADLRAVYDDAMAGCDGIVETEMAAFNDLFHSLGIPAVTLPADGVPEEKP